MATVVPELNYLQTSNGHRLAYAEFGNPSGRALLYLHGGPGADCNEALAHLFNLAHFRLIMLDQRGCGASRPAGGLVENNTQALLADNECLREHLGIRRWWVYGGSWGATLALEYAKQYREVITGLVLRGSFLARQEDLQWFIGADGVAQLYPGAYQTLCEQLSAQPETLATPIERGKQPIPPISLSIPLTTRLYERLLRAEDDVSYAYQAAYAWECWEMTVMRLPPPARSEDINHQKRLVASKRIYAHYCHHGFFLSEQGVLPGIEGLRGMPLILVHGKQDQVCRLQALQPLLKVLPKATLHVVEAGHGIHEPAIGEKLREVFARLAH